MTWSEFAGYWFLAMAVPVVSISLGFFIGVAAAERGMRKAGEQGGTVYSAGKIYYIQRVGKVGRNDDCSKPAA